MACGQGGFAQVHGAASLAQCAAWLERIFLDRDLWIDRFDGRMFSYGRSWYLDIEHGILHTYFAQAERSNALMYALPGMVEALLGAARLLEGPRGERDLPVRPRRANLGPYWCDAGVHIVPEGHGGDVHADYEGLAPYPARMFDAETRAYSAVLALTGSPVGLELYTGERLLADAAPDAIDAIVEAREPVRLRYEPGTLTVFDSFLLHSIPPPPSLRATAVAHFLYLEQPFPHWEHWF